MHHSNANEFFTVDVDTEQNYDLNNGHLDKSLRAKFPTVNNNRMAKLSSNFQAESSSGIYLITIAL